MAADTLVIVESPAKAKTIGKYLGSKYIVRASFGHIRDLPKSQIGVDIEQGFEPQYITIRGKGDVLKELRNARKKVNKVVLAADPDREGEAIAWHLAHYLDVAPDSACRVVFNEITKQAVKDAFKSPRPINMDLVNAQQARRILDRLVGYKISPLLWKKVKKGLSAGRVQSVAVKLILDRENEIEAFVPEEYWSINARLVTVNGAVVEARYHSLDGVKGAPHSEEAVRHIVAAIGEHPFVVASLTEKERTRNAAAPFTTSSLQQEAARKLGFRASKTMSVAQGLYEGVELGKEGTVGLITYMRTDSTRVSPIAQEEARSLIVERYGAAYVPSEPRNHAKKAAANAQDAHEAIRPTSAGRDPESLKALLTKDQFKLYKLIWERFIASQMASAVLDTVSADLHAARAGQGPKVVFRANGSKIKFHGFMKLYIEGTDDAADPSGESDDERYLPALLVGESLNQQKPLESKQHFTQPPPRYTEARLVRTMEEIGIGRPSTYAPTLETIQKRGYVALEEKKFIPTELGTLVIQLMEEFFPEILDAEFTAHMEGDLDHVEEGNADWVRVLGSFYETFAKRLEHAEAEMESVELTPEYADEPCEKCGRPMIYRMGRFGKFLACSGFPDCRNAKPIVKETGVMCPTCGEGHIIERRSKKGRIFYGCNQYPGCDFVSWDRPIAQPCQQCSKLMVEKRTRAGVKHVCTSCDHSIMIEDQEE